MTTRSIPLSLVALALVACTPGTPAGAPSPGASGGSPAPKASGSPATSASAKPGAASTSPTVAASAAVAAGPAVPNTGTFTWAAGMAPRWLRTEKGPQDGQPIKHITFKIGEVKDDRASYEVLQQVDLAKPAGTIASGSFSLTAGGDGLQAFVDVNLDPRFGGDVLAAAQAQGEETVTVPAGTFVCAKTLYDKDKGNGMRVNITRWWNGQVGLVKAQVSNAATVAGTTLTADIRYELEVKP